MIAIAVEAEKPPLREGVDGELRVGSTRVLLELVIRAFQEGATPETIVQRYSSLTLADTYSVIAYYLRHKAEVDAYMVARKKKAETTKSEIEAAQGDLTDIRRRLAGPRRGAG